MDLADVVTFGDDSRLIDVTQVAEGLFNLRSPRTRSGSGRQSGTSLRRACLRARNSSTRDAPGSSLKCGARVANGDG
jgi:hypothetical protein